MRTTRYTLLLLFVMPLLWGQTPCQCCSESHQQFDFWVGHWVVKDTLGNKVGENLISRAEGNCVITEKWKGASGTTGMSVNYFDSSDATWNQLWIDNQGNILKLKGTFDSGKMLLKSDLIKGGEQEYRNQIAWSLNEDGSVTQSWETTDVNGSHLKTLFKGIYSRISD